MNEQPVVHAPQPNGQNAWLDAYMPEGPLGPVHLQQQTLSFATLRGIIYRQRWLVGAVLSLALVCGIVISLLTTPLYEATAKVAAKPYEQIVVEGQGVNQGFSPIQILDFLATQVEIVQSRGLAEAVAADLDLGSRSSFLGEGIEEGRPAGISDRDWKKQKEQLAASILVEGVQAEVPSRNWVMTIGFRSNDPVMAAEIANAYADAFVASGARKSISENEYALEYLTSQIGDTRQRLSEAEQTANAYARNSGIIIDSTGMVEGGTPSTLTASNLSSINSRVASARAARIEAEQRWRAIQNLPVAQLPEVQSSQVLQGLLSDRTSKMSQLADLRQRYNDSFPQIQTLLAQVRVLDEQIERSSSDIKATSRSQFLVAQSQERALEAELADLTGSRMVEQENQVELSALEREAQALRDQLKSLLDRYNQVSSAANVDPGTITKIDSALVPNSPIEPSFPRNIGIALALGLALAVGLAVLRELFDDRIRSLDEVEQKLGLPLLGHTPHLEQRDIELQEANQFSALMEAYASIRAAIDFTLPRNRNVIQLTSAEASEGKSTTSVILAELFASLGRKTLLVDADLRRPSVASILNIERPKVGLVEVVLGHAQMEDAVVKGVHKNLEILPVGAVPPNPSEILASREMREFIEKYRHEYSLIIFDSCPVMGLADAPILANLVDGTVFVLEANRLPFGQARHAIRRLALSGGNIIGAVLTKYRALEAGQAYGYQYGYYEYGGDR